MASAYVLLRVIERRGLNMKVWTWNGDRILHRSLSNT